MSKIVPTSKFKKQFKKVKKNPRWRKIFYGSLPFDNYSPWQYVINCFINDQPLDDYFYEHSITLNNKQKKEIKKRIDNSLGSESLAIRDIKALDLHFDGHNGDHLLIYIRTQYKLIYLIQIGSHSELFK